MNDIELKKKQLALLKETCAHFNWGNRSWDPNMGKCLYSGVGCAIGRKINDKELCSKLDAFANTSVNSRPVYELLPSSLSDLGRPFLTCIQQLHDQIDNWTGEGLSSEGQAYRQYIIDEFKLKA